MATADGSEDINDFLLRIRELGDRRDREDEERTRKLEEEILQGRKERQARRAERARSISPTKERSSNGGTPTSVRSTIDSPRQEDVTISPITLQPSQASLGTMGDEAKIPVDGTSNIRRPSPPRDLPQPPSKPATLSTTSPSPSMALSRAGTLSWQQRPTSRGSTGPRARPLSQFAAENSAAKSPRASVEPPSLTERELSKDEIAESLGSKDPTWFSQTQERGLESAAYRRDRNESVSDALSTNAGMRLPGMSREPTVEPERQGSPAVESIRSLSPSRGSSIRDGPLRPIKQSTSASLSSSNSIRSPLPIMSSHIFDPPGSETTPSGENGFPPGGTMPTSLVQGRISPERLERSPSPTKGLGGFVQSAMLKRSDSVSKRWSAQPGTGLSRGNSIASNRSGYEASRYGISSLYAPQDQAPTRSSRETSPVASPRPGSSQSTIHSIRDGKENDRPNLSGVLKPIQAADAPIDVSATLPSQYESTDSNLDQGKPNRDRTKSETSPPSSPSKRWSPTKSSWLENAINKPDSPKPRMPPPQQPSWMANLNQSKQQRGATDPGKSSNFKEVSTGGLLRSPPMGTINKPQGSGDRKPTEDAEFRNVFGKLKKTQTQNYVAPDELKGNILRGKAGLSVTGGPKKTERRDEFKESLLKQKEAMKAGSPPAVGRKPSLDTSAKPEALAKLQHLRGEKSRAAAPPPAGPPVNERKGLDFNSSLAGMLARGPSPMTGRDQSTPKAVPQTGGRVLDPTADGIYQSPEEGAPLTHMTKARARGPKRRLPTNSSAKVETSSRDSLRNSSPTLTKTISEPDAKIESPSTLNKEPQARPLSTISDNHRKPSQPQSPRKPSVGINKSNLEPTATQLKSLPTTKLQPRSPETERPRKPSTSVLPISSKSPNDTPSSHSPRSPPLLAKKPPSMASKVVSNGTMGEAAEAGRLFAELFDELPTNDVKVNIDTPAVLASRTPVAEANKIKTLRKQLWEVTAGGKLISVPPDQSHILFEESLYICHHVFGNLSAGTRNTEVFLWCGDGVPTSAVEDAHIFARKEAKDRGGKLIVLAQGKETANFFQALGGIVITRHGQSDRASSRYMLCGRRHMGQIAFDEVDFSPESLCKGFPYIISSGSGKVHLWKGSGSGVDELGCARLIGMDLGVRGEIEEVDDGSEPDSFWDCFPNGRKTSPTARDALISKHWQLKPSSEHYATRLYQVDIEAPRPKSNSGFMWGRRGSAPATEENATFNAQIKEIAPFAQSDVFNDGVFVLDTFFEIFVMLPSFPSTSTILSTFRTTLLFAQEYAILAASAHDENRPFVPISSVVLFGVGRDSVPEGLRMAFRKWEGGKVRGCRVLGLAASIEATGMVGR
ncbi:MAG: hypothetical protein Q9204_002333, partial [Flavoplaca sp. TL-2023a]